MKSLLHIAALLVISTPAWSTASELVDQVSFPGTEWFTATGDMSGDGWDDFARLLDPGNGLARLQVFEATPHSPFTPWLSKDFNTNFRELRRVGDVDGDGRADLVIDHANAGSTPDLWYGFGTGSAASVELIPSRVLWEIKGYAGAGHDLDDDGYGDFVVLNRRGNVSPDAEWTLHRGQAVPDGVHDLVLPGGIFTDYESPGDLDGDGLPDLLYIDAGTVSFLRGGPSFDAVPDHQQVLASDLGTVLSVDNFSGSGGLELAAIVPLASGDELRVYGVDATFQLTQRFSAPIPGLLGHAPTDAILRAAGDSDGDGHGDLVLTIDASAWLLRGGASPDAVLDADFGHYPSPTLLANELMLDWDRDGAAEFAALRRDSYDDRTLLIWAEPFFDADDDGQPDAPGSFDDCDADSVPDAIFASQYPGLDCDGNGVPDHCDLVADPWRDCDENGVLDDCELLGADCDANGVLDRCELEEDDCDANGLLDRCQIAANPGTVDCDANGWLDACELDEHPFLDCDWDDAPNSCEIAGGSQVDVDGDGHPDGCDQPWSSSVSLLGDPGAGELLLAAPGTQEISIWLHLDPAASLPALVEIQFGLELPPGVYVFSSEAQLGGDEQANGQEQFGIIFDPPLVLPAGAGDYELARATIVFADASPDQRISIKGCGAVGCDVSVPRMKLVPDAAPAIPVRHSRVLWVNPSAADCQRNGMLDPDEIVRGHAVDLAGDGVPDECQTLTGVPDREPRATALHAPVPNPFNPRTTLSFTLAEAGPVELVVYDVAGRRVAVLAEGPWPAGRHQLQWDGKDGAGQAVGSGVYLARLRAGDTGHSRRLVLLR